MTERKTIIPEREKQKEEVRTPNRRRIAPDPDRNPIPEPKNA